jgi:hypothetical protein
VIDGRYAAEKDAEVMGEGGRGSRRREGSELGILKIYTAELTMNLRYQAGELTVNRILYSLCEFSKMTQVCVDVTAFPPKIQIDGVVVFCLRPNNIPAQRGFGVHQQ